MADVKMINGFTGTVMYVPEERVEEYRTAGHVPADALQEPQEQQEPKEEPQEQQEPKEEPQEPRKRKKKE